MYVGTHVTMLSIVGLGPGAGTAGVPLRGPVGLSPPAPAGKAGLWVKGFGFRVYGLGLRVYRVGRGFGVRKLRFRI